jgi:hypothetical protein
MSRIAAFYLTAYRYYFGGAVAACSVFYGKVGYAVGLYNHAMRSLSFEGVADGVFVGVKAIGADFLRISLMVSNDFTR